MKIISAKSGNNGLAIGKLLLHTAFTIPVPEKTSDIVGETKRLRNAIGCTYNSYNEQLNRCKNAKNDKASAILETQLMMLYDDSFTQACEKLLKDGYIAEYAVYASSEEIAVSFEQSDSDYMRARSADIRSIGKKIVGILRGVGIETMLMEDTIIFAEEISPEMLVSFDKKFLKGIVSDSGSTLSHTAILAGTLGIPYVFNVNRSLCPQNGTHVIVNGETGTVICEPDDQTLKEYREQLKKSDEIVIGSDVKLPVKLYSNISGPQDLEAVLQNGSDGIGLFRTEFLFMQSSDLPSEEEQFDVYSQVARAMKGKEVIIRTMDIGADKKTACLVLPEEANPALGKRAIRICLDNTELFRTQLRALLRAACFGNIKILYPMITSEWEITEIEKQLGLAADELKKRDCAFRIPEYGVMIETPSAAVISDKLAQRVNFFSIGSNDLTQYTLAADRLNSSMEQYFESEHEAVFRLIQMTVKNAHDHNIAVGLCGEIGGKPSDIPKLIDIGIDELSMPPAKIPAARKAIYEYIDSPEYKAKHSSTDSASDLFASHAQLYEEIAAPCDGIIVEMQDIPDAVFSSGALGRCIAVEPECGIVYAPCDGTITMIAETYHALSIHTASGRDILIHAGIDTVTLNGDGFDCKVNLGDSVRCGDIILVEDIKLIKDKGLSPMIIMLF